MPDKKKDPYDINLIFEAMTLALIDSLKRNLIRHKNEEIKEGFRWEMWQKTKLRNLAAFRKRNRKIVSDASRTAEKLVDDVLKQSFADGEKAVEKVVARIAQVEGTIELPKDFKATIKPKPSVPELPKTPVKAKVPIDIKPSKPTVPYVELPKAPPESSFFGMNEKKLEALQETVKKDLQKAQHGVMRKMDDVYRQVIYKAEINMAAGAKTLNQAIDMSTKEFLEKGINTIEYSDGRRVSITAYAEMALRTASQRATFLGEGKKRDEWGVYTVVMSAHANSSPMCLPYQGTVMIDDVYTSISKEDAAKLSKETKYILLSEAMKNFAFHPNCRHTLATYFPGITQLPAAVDDEKAVERYNAEQQQRYIERHIRKYKRLKAGSVDEVNELRYKKKVREWQNRLEEHLDEHDYLRRDRAREKAG